jgi:hypothetical protein
MDGTTGQPGQSWNIDGRRAEGQTLCAPDFQSCICHLWGHMRVKTFPWALLCWMHTRRAEYRCAVLVSGNQGLRQLRNPLSCTDNNEWPFTSAGCCEQLCQGERG